MKFKFFSLIKCDVQTDITFKIALSYICTFIYFPSEGKFLLTPIHGKLKQKYPRHFAILK